MTVNQWKRKKEREHYLRLTIAIASGITIGSMVWSMVATLTVALGKAVIDQGLFL